ncbi:hypothetical protein NONO_c60190 [Nocardia nova SH22a]|uniref:Uncharacterized protein n=1 Tax=Nocardia nova SH22a TaxID=1415166 RepID=W5TN63_9NOCA|nr:hypothetical protein [Nocardia nova]AHH20795.1 hypothetical protein NONO_c60190 [Nocardia nova SH22a]
MSSNQPRDQLAELIASHEWSRFGGSLGEQLAERICAEGWRPPAETIYDYDDLDDLPDLSAILHNGFVYQRFEGSWWCGRVEHLSDWFAGQPVTVIHTPGETHV